MNTLSSLGITAEFVFVYATIISLLVGSFLNVVIHRVPKMMQEEWNHDCCELLEIEQKAEQKKFNLITPNSHCPNCKSAIKPWQNIPVISYLFLKGKCANCHEKISARYPLIEFITGALGLFLAIHYGVSTQLIFATVLTWTLISLTMIDIDHQLLPDSITLPLLWLGILVNSQGVFVSLESSVFGAIFGYLSLWSIFWLFKLLTGKEGMGYGDFKLLAALGAWMGWQALPVIIILSSFVGAAIGIAGILIVGRDKNIPIPFGPYLAIAGWITLLWGNHITQAYLNYSGMQ